MADDPLTNGAAEPQPKTLREVAEAAYDEVVDEGLGPVESDNESQEGDRPRDERGRFVSKSQDGEAEAETPPSPPEETQGTEEHPAQPPAGVAAQAPSNWSAEDRANFAKLPQGWAQEFLLRRHSELESDYQKRVQANAFSNQIAEGLAPVARDPELTELLRRENVPLMQAIYQWAAFHKRAMNPDPESKTRLLYELASRMQLDPAVVFGRQASPMAFTKEELANPATKKFADHIGLLTSQLQQQRQAWTQFQQREQQNQIALKRADVDAFADARNPDGSLKHPKFDHYIHSIMATYQSEPMTMEEAYNRTVKAEMDKDRAEYEAQHRAQLDQQQSVQKAQVAARGNTRGLTAPVSKPAPPTGKRSLRDVMEESAQEIGFEG